jgi:SNF2 family DNA or RNA helicase
VEATAEEAACYRDLSVLVRDSAGRLGGKHRLSLHHLLTAAGSSPPAGATALRRFAEKHAGGCGWSALAERYAAIALGAKEGALLELLRRNPDEKKMVFIHHRETLEHLDALLTERGISFARFDGGLSGPEKDAAIGAFRDRDPVLLCTESGGEGRNVQFCNTLINFDIPWNPMVIEQRIGRIDRIGQEREVFVFNLVARDTLEDRMLAILDEKINMFELVVGEVGAILGEMDEDKDFAEMILGAWLESTETGREAAFSEVGRRMVEAKHTYESAKTLDGELFGEDFETA